MYKASNINTVFAILIQGFKKTLFLSSCIVPGDNTLGCNTGVFREFPPKDLPGFFCIEGFSYLSLLAQLTIKRRRGSLLRGTRGTFPRKFVYHWVERPGINTYSWALKRQNLNAIALRIAKNKTEKALIYRFSEIEIPWLWAQISNESQRQSHSVLKRW